MWSSSTSAGSTTCSGSSRSSSPNADAASACWSTTWSAGARRPGSSNGSTASRWGEFVLVPGHPFVDIWQAVKPERVGLKVWPDIPRSIEWKHGICEVLRLPHADQADIARAWQAILARVRNWNDLERPLLTSVEQLIDFVTQDEPVS